MFEENINNITENKLILLFILNEAKSPLTNTQITEIILKNDLMNYFLLQQYLSDLIEHKQIETYTKDNKEFYRLSERGQQTLSFFESRIPVNKKDELIKTLAEKQKEFKRSTEIYSNYIPINEREYMVECKIIERGTPLIEIKLPVGTKAQAKEICRNWNLNSEKIYSQIISAFSMKDEN